MATSKGGYVSGGFDILKAPNAPTITSVATSIGSASVAFTAPTDVGGGAITSYTITAVDESTGASTGAVGSASPITISPGGGTFKIRAAATNIYGPGRVSQYDTGKQIYSGAELWTAGNNFWGQIGDQTTVNRFSFTQVGLLSNWSQVASGGNSATQGTTAAVKTDGTLWAWGFNDKGQLGQNDTAPRSSPVQVGALTNWYQVALTRGSSVAIKTDGTLWSWGYNGNGDLGQNNIISRSSPVQVGSLTNWGQVSCGYLHVSAIKTDGTLWGWGRNNAGQVGDGTVIPRSSPVQIGALTNWSQVSVGGFSSGDFTVAVTKSGTIFAWGYAGQGQLGNSNVIRRSSPVQIGGMTNWSQAATGDNFSIAVKTDGTLWGWGANFTGSLGTGNTTLFSSPVQVGALTNWRRAAAGGNGSSGGTTAAVKTDGTLWTWGLNNKGQLGLGGGANRSSPVQVGSLTNWVQTSAAGENTAALYGVV